MVLDERGYFSRQNPFPGETYSGFQPHSVLRAPAFCLGVLLILVSGNVSTFGLDAVDLLTAPLAPWRKFLREPMVWALKLILFASGVVVKNAGPADEEALVLVANRTHLSARCLLPSWSPPASFLDLLVLLLAVGIEGTPVLHRGDLNVLNNQDPDYEKWVETYQGTTSLELGSASKSQCFVSERQRWWPRCRRALYCMCCCCCRFLSFSSSDKNKNKNSNCSKRIFRCPTFCCSNLYGSLCCCGGILRRLCRALFVRGFIRGFQCIVLPSDSTSPDRNCLRRRQPQQRSTTSFSNSSSSSSSTATNGNASPPLAPSSSSSPTPSRYLAQVLRSRVLCSPVWKGTPALVFPEAPVRGRLLSGAFSGKVGKEGGGRLGCCGRDVLGFRTGCGAFRCGVAVQPAALVLHSSSSSSSSSSDGGGGNCNGSITVTLRFCPVVNPPSDSAAMAASSSAAAAPEPLSVPLPLPPPLQSTLPVLLPLSHSSSHRLSGSSSSSSASHSEAFEVWANDDESLAFGETCRKRIVAVLEVAQSSVVAADSIVPAIPSPPTTPEVPPPPLLPPSQSALAALTRHGHHELLLALWAYRTRNDAAHARPLVPETNKSRGQCLCKNKNRSNQNYGWRKFFWCWIWCCRRGMNNSDDDDENDGTVDEENDDTFSAAAAASAATKKKNVTGQRCNPNSTSVGSGGLSVVACLSNMDAISVEGFFLPAAEEVLSRVEAIDLFALRLVTVDSHAKLVAERQAAAAAAAVAVGMERAQEMVAPVGALALEGKELSVKHGLDDDIKWLVDRFALRRCLDVGDVARRRKGHQGGVVPPAQQSSSSQQNFLAWEVDALFDALDENEEGVIDLRELVAVVVLFNSQESQLQRHAALRLIFRMFKKERGVLLPAQKDQQRHQEQNLNLNDNAGSNGGQNGTCGRHRRPWMHIFRLSRVLIRAFPWQSLPSGISSNGNVDPTTVTTMTTKQMEIELEAILSGSLAHLKDGHTISFTNFLLWSKNNAKGFVDFRFGYHAEHFDNPPCPVSKKADTEAATRTETTSGGLNSSGSGCRNSVDCDDQVAHQTRRGVFVYFGLLRNGVGLSRRKLRAFGCEGLTTEARFSAVEAELAVAPEAKKLGADHAVLRCADLYAYHFRGDTLGGTATGPDPLVPSSTPSTTGTSVSGSRHKKDKRLQDYQHRKTNSSGGGGGKSTTKSCLGRWGHCDLWRLVSVLGQPDDLLLQHGGRASMLLVLCAPPPWSLPPPSTPHQPLQQQLGSSSALPRPTATLGTTSKGHSPNRRIQRGENSSSSSSMKTTKTDFSQSVVPQVGQEGQQEEVASNPMHRTNGEFEQQEGGVSDSAQKEIKGWEQQQQQQQQQLQREISFTGDVVRNLAASSHNTTSLKTMDRGSSNTQFRWSEGTLQHTHALEANTDPTSDMSTGGGVVGASVIDPDKHFRGPVYNKHEQDIRWTLACGESASIGSSSGPKASTTKQHGLSQGSNTSAAALHLWGGAFSWGCPQFGNACCGNHLRRAEQTFALAGGDTPPAAATALVSRSKARHAEAIKREDAASNSSGNRDVDQDIGGWVELPFSCEKLFCPSTPYPYPAMMQSLSSHSPSSTSRGEKYSNSVPSSRHTAAFASFSQAASAAAETSVEAGALPLVCIMFLRLNLNRCQSDDDDDDDDDPDANDTLVSNQADCADAAYDMNQPETAPLNPKCFGLRSNRLSFDGLPSKIQKLTYALHFTDGEGETGEDNDDNDDDEDFDEIKCANDDWENSKNRDGKDGNNSYQSRCQNKDVPVSKPWRQGSSVIACALTPLLPAAAPTSTQSSAPDFTHCLVLVCAGGAPGLHSCFSSQRFARWRDAVEDLLDYRGAKDTGGGRADPGNSPAPLPAAISFVYRCRPHPADYNVSSGGTATCRNGKAMTTMINEERSLGLSKNIDVV